MSGFAVVEQRVLAELRACVDEVGLPAWHSKYFGKQGEVLLAIKKVGEVPPGERRVFGQEANRLKESLTKKYEKALESEQEKKIGRDLQNDALDVTLPGRPVRRGPLPGAHPHHP